MSKLLIENPSFVRLKDFSNPQLELCKSILTFKDRSIEFLYKKHQKNFYWKQRDYGSWESHLNALKAAITRSCLFEDELGFYTYAGLASDISMALGGIEIASVVSYPDTNSIAYDQVPPPFRPYQEKIIEKLIEKKHGAVSVGTGLGKSLCIVGLCHYLGLRSLIMAPSRSIAVQLYDDFCKYFGAKKVGLYGDGKKQIGKLFTIGIAASLTRIEPGSKDWEWLSKCNVWLNDECLPYNSGVITDKGTLSIGSIVSRFRKGEKLKALSWNGTSFEYKNITNVHDSAMKPLIKIEGGSFSITCSLDHKILTEEGWKAAKDITTSDFLVGNHNYSSTAMKSDGDVEQFLIGSYLGDGSFSKTKGNNFRIRVIHGNNQKEYLEWKSSIFNSKIEYIPLNGYSKKPAYRFTTPTIALSKIWENGCSPKKINESLLSLLDWKGLAIWIMDDASVIKKNGEWKGFRLHTEGFSFEEQLILVKKLKSMGIESSIKKAFRGNKKYYIILINLKSSLEVAAKIAPFVHPNLSYKIPKFLRYQCGMGLWVFDTKKSSCRVTKTEMFPVEKIENYKKGNRTDRLYDIEVEDNHNFVATSGRRIKTGVVVHNCHLTPATTFEKVAMGLCKEVPYRFFFSATHLRGDGADLVLKGITGDIVYNMDVTQGISEGWLARPSFKMITVKSESKYKSDDVQKMTRNHFYKNIDVYKKAAFLINNFVKLAKHQVLVLIDEICQFEYLYPLLEHECRFAHGQGATEMSKKIPSTFAKSNLKKLVNDFNAYEYPILIGTSCIGLGTDIKSVNTVIYLMAGKSETQIMQAVGRGTRKCKRLDGSEKTEFNFIDFAIRIKNDDFDDFDRNKGLMSPVFRHVLCRQSYYNKIYPNSTKWM